MADVQEVLPPNPCGAKPFICIENTKCSGAHDYGYCWLVWVLVVVVVIVCVVAYAMDLSDYFDGFFAVALLIGLFLCLWNFYIGILALVAVIIMGSLNVYMRYITNEALKRNMAMLESEINENYALHEKIEKLKKRSRKRRSTKK